MALEIGGALRIIVESAGGAGRQVGAAVSGLGGAVGGMGLQSVPDLAIGPGAPHLNRLRAQAIAKRSAQTGALGGLASQAPMAKTFMAVGKGFAAGGPIAGAAMGITAIVGMVKQLLGMSKIFGTFSKTFFQMTSMMIDMALMPMIPHLMRFLQWWLREGTKKATEVGNWLAKNGPNIAKAMAGLAKLLGFMAGGVNPANHAPGGSHANAGGGPLQGLGARGSAQPAGHARPAGGHRAHSRTSSTSPMARPQRSKLPASALSTARARRTGRPTRRPSMRVVRNTVRS